MTQLSPAASAIWDTYNAAFDEAGVFTDYGDALAAAFKTAADILREAYANEELMDPADDWLNDIATELENCND